MPLYEYTCLDCNTRFDALRSMKDADTHIECTQCGSDHISRLISLFNAQSSGRVIAGSTPSCAGCSATSCATCGH